MLVLAALALLLVVVQVAADMFSPALIQSGLTDVSDTLNLPPESHENAGPQLAKVSTVPTVPPVPPAPPATRQADPLP